jgi:hypothetical protein
VDARSERARALDIAGPCGSPWRPGSETMNPYKILAALNNKDDYRYIKNKKEVSE